LGIETSCDDTGVAVVRSDGVILGEALASQYQIHEQWGGVVPGLARDAHASVIDSMVQEALSKAGMATAGEVDAIGVTVGPGLEICLRVGCETAKGLAELYKKPFVAVHHLEAHCLMARLGQPLVEVEVEVEEEGAREEGGKEKEVGEGGVASILPLARFPFLALLVSGGHCMILECADVGRYRILGGTLDDALGEAYDKAARLLKVGSGAAGGPAMELLAREGDPKAVLLPVPMKGKKNLNFSYAGLKNAFRMAVTRVRESQGGGEGGGEEGGELDHQTKADLAASFQNVAIQHLEDRLERAMKESEGRGIHTLAVVGGVAANQAIRTRLHTLCEKRTLARKREMEKERAWVEEMGGSAAEAAAAVAVAEELPAWELVVPPPRLCTDNGVMVAWAAIEKLRLGYSDVLEGQDVHARWPFANLEKEKEEEAAEAVVGGGESRP
jgi:N6-L-threonylcarbamoyladenine synthase